VKPQKHAALIRKLQSSGTAGEQTIRHLPPWVGACRLLVEQETTWIYVQPRTPDAGPQPGQLVLDLPAARYLVEILDSASGTWISRESAAGNPLVAGLPFSKNPQLIRITRSRL
jgi:hypothetical protein